MNIIEEVVGNNFYRTGHIVLAPNTGMKLVPVVYTIIGHTHRDFCDGLTELDRAVWDWWADKFPFDFIFITSD